MYLRSNRFPQFPRPRNKKKIHQEQFQVNDTSISQSTTDTLNLYLNRATGRKPDP